MKICNLALSYGRIAKIAAQFSHGLVNSAMGQISCSTERISCLDYGDYCNSLLELRFISRIRTLVHETVVESSSRCKPTMCFSAMAFRTVCTYQSHAPCDVDCIFVLSHSLNRRWSNGNCRKLSVFVPQFGWTIFSWGEVTLLTKILGKRRWRASSWFQPVFLRHFQPARLMQCSPYWTESILLFYQDNQLFWLCDCLLYTSPSPRD